MSSLSSRSFTSREWAWHGCLSAWSSPEYFCFLLGRLLVKFVLLYKRVGLISVGLIKRNALYTRVQIITNCYSTHLKKSRDPHLLMIKTQNTTARGWSDPYSEQVVTFEPRSRSELLVRIVRSIINQIQTSDIWQSMYLPNKTNGPLDKKSG